MREEYEVANARACQSLNTQEAWKTCENVDAEFLKTICFFNTLVQSNTGNKKLKDPKNLPNITEVEKSPKVDDLD